MCSPPLLAQARRRINDRHRSLFFLCTQVRNTELEAANKAKQAPKADTAVAPVTPTPADGAEGGAAESEALVAKEAAGGPVLKRGSKA